MDLYVAYAFGRPNEDSPVGFGRVVIENCGEPRTVRDIELLHNKLEKECMTGSARAVVISWRALAR